MPKFIITLDRDITFRGTLEIEAPSENEAEQLAIQLCSNIHTTHTIDEQFATDGVHDIEWELDNDYTELYEVTEEPDSVLEGETPIL